MISKFIIYPFSLLFWFSIANADSDSYSYGVVPSIVACEFSAPSVFKRMSYLGFDIRIFDYEFGNTALEYDNDFMASDYTSNTLLYSLTAEQDINFSGTVSDADLSIPYEGTLFGQTFEVSNFVAEFTSYFYASQSGFYKFESDNVDDSMMFFIGADRAFECSSKASTSEIIASSSSSSNMFTGSHNESIQYFYQYLTAGYLYPIRITYANAASDYAMSLKVTYPDGTIIDDFNNGDFVSPNYYSQIWYPGDVYSLTVAAEFVTISSSWTGNTTSYSTTYTTSGDGGITVYDFGPDPTTTVTAHYHGLTVSSTLVTPTGAGTWIESIFYPEETVSSYIPWTGATTMTSTTVIPENPEIPATIVIAVPDAIITTTSQWTGSETSERTNYPAEGQNGTIIVEVLTPRKTDTSYIAWTGTETIFSTTILPENMEIAATVIVKIPDSTSTATVLWTGTEVSSSTIYPENGQNSSVIVEILNPQGTETLTDFWSGSTTYYITDGPSEFGNDAIVHEYVPQSVVSNGIVYITTYWTGDFTSYSTVNPNYSNDTTTVLVNIPQQTITETWTGTLTSTSFYCPDNGTASIPIVLIPSSTIFPNDCDNCEPSSSGTSSSPSAETTSALDASSDLHVSNFIASSSSLFAESTSSGHSDSTIVIPDLDIGYSNLGNSLKYLNFNFFVSLLITCYFAS